jgi:hypothetical protein
MGYLSFFPFPVVSIENTSNNTIFISFPIPISFCSFLFVCSNVPYEVNNYISYKPNYRCVCYELRRFLVSAFAPLFFSTFPFSLHTHPTIFVLFYYYCFIFVSVPTPKLHMFFSFFLFPPSPLFVYYTLTRFSPLCGFPNCLPISNVVNVYCCDSNSLPLSLILLVSYRSFYFQRFLSNTTKRNRQKNYISFPIPILYCHFCSIIIYFF